MHLERMTSPDIAAAVKAGRTTVVMACGAVEQHGPHLPLFMDAEHGTRLAEAVAERLRNALVAPTIRIGCSDHHMAFAGTLTLREETFAAVVEDCCTSLARHGFRRILIVPTHGGNFAPLRRLLPGLRKRLGDACDVDAYTDLHGVMRVWRDAIEAVAPGLGERVGGHADIAETSIMALLHPQLVAADRATAGFSGELTEDVLARMFAHGIGAIAPNGILGDARGFGPALGERCIDALADEMVARFAAGAPVPVVPPPAGS